MDIQTNINRINNDKQAIKQAIEAKGDITITSSTLIDYYSVYVEDIVVGGTVDIEKFLSTNGITRLVLTSDIAMPVTTSQSVYDEPFFDCQGIKELVIQSDAVIPNNTFGKEGASTAPFGSPIEKITITSATYCERDYEASSTATNPSLSYALVWGAPSITNQRLPICSKIVIDCQPTRLGNHLFSDFVNLTSIDIPETVTELGQVCFSGCGFETFTIPSQITTLGTYCFRKCLSLATVYCEPTTPPTIGNNIFYNCTALAHIYVPSESVEAYKQASGWSNYASIIEAMPS